MIKKSFYFVLFLLLLYCGTNLITPHSKFLRNRSIRAQILSIHTEIEKGEDYVLRDKYPEGFIFCHALYAMSVIEYMETTNHLPCFYTDIIDSSIDKLVVIGYKKFDEQLPLKYGAFYNGWVNLVLKKYISSRAFMASKNKAQIIELHNTFNSRILEAYQSEKRALETYTESVWPSDNLVCLASLPSGCGADEVRKYIYNGNTNLLPHSYFDQSIQRGASTALNIYLETNAHFCKAVEINEMHQDTFVDRFLGVEFVSEYTDGFEGENGGDIDSGPLLFGYGSAGTVMNIKTQAALGNNSASTWGLMNTLGLPIRYKHRKFYLFKKEMIFDLFMLWSCVEIELMESL